jgi:hypothetical protein
LFSKTLSNTFSGYKVSNCFRDHLHSEPQALFHTHDQTSHIKNIYFLLNHASPYQQKKWSSRSYNPSSGYQPWDGE